MFSIFVYWITTIGKKLLSCNEDEQINLQIQIHRNENTTTHIVIYGTFIFIAYLIILHSDNLQSCELPLTFPLVNYNDTAESEHNAIWSCNSGP